jgi:hypothetical protein
MLNLKNKRIAVASHDAGGAEILSSYIKNKKISCDYYLRGPAKNIFKEKLNLNDSQLINKVNFEIDFLLTGTSWQSDFELNFINKFRKKNIPVISFIDHWTLYSERFLRNGRTNIPDTIIVTDNFAFEKAKKIFKETPIYLIKNYYIHDLIKSYKKLSENSITQCNKILYLTEPISASAKKIFGNPKHYNYDEFEALEFALNNLDKINKKNCNILIRMHPSENKKKYINVISKYNFDIKISNHEDILEDFLSANIVIGCNTMAMVIALFLGKRVYSSIPPKGIGFAIPFPKIIKISDIV